ncbi:hypothetical protein IV203_030280 [Nitzschia inconspicua]|uniref:Uncharacterized protein n=1 Tax=Nitzschia inconspicua TaxID=303405 RepID=A0A9K3LS88_9STRA|nr:hypothetical protein IV203_030280 [Nitzschia inconspicua]
MFNATAAHAEGSLFTTFDDNDTALEEAIVFIQKQQQLEQPPNQQFNDAQNQNLVTATQSSASPRSQLQTLIAMARPTVLQQLFIWEPVILLQRLRLRLVVICISIINYFVDTMTQKPSKWMHEWTNPMAELDLIPAERPKLSIMKVRTLQESVESKYHPGGSDPKKTQETLTAPEIRTVQDDDTLPASLADCSSSSREKHQFKTPILGRSFDATYQCVTIEYITTLSVIIALIIMAPIAATVAFDRILADRKRREQQRHRTPDIFVHLKEKPRYQGPKKSFWQAWADDDPDIDTDKHGFLLLRDVQGITSILKNEAVMEVETQRKPLSFVDQVGVKLIPPRFDKCNANAYLKDLGETVEKNYSDVDEELERAKVWKHIYTTYALSAFHRHFAALTSQWQLPAVDAASALMGASVANSSGTTTTNNVEFPTTDSNENHDGTEEFPTTLNDGNDDETATMNEIFPNNATDITDSVISNETLSSIGSSNNDNATTTPRRRSPKPRHHTTLKSTGLEIDEATVWVNGRRRSSRFQPKRGSVVVNGRRTSARLLQRSS